MSLSLIPTTLPPVFSRNSLGLESPSTPLPVSASVQQGPSGRRGTLSSPWHSPPLGLEKTFYIAKLNGKGPCTPCGKQHTLQCLTEETDWQKSGGCSIFLRSPQQTPFLSLFFFTPHLLAADLHADEGVRKSGTESER